MNPAAFDKLTRGSGALYVPFAGAGQHYELVSIGVVWGEVNNRIRVNVFDANGQPGFGAWVRHSFGDEFERFQFTGEAVQFNLGTGSHYSVPDDPPDRITIEGGSSDAVWVGNANLIGYAHTEWQMAFQLVDRLPLPPPPSPSPTPPSPPGARQRFRIYLTGGTLEGEIEIS